MCCLVASSWLLSVGFTDGFCCKCVCCCTAESPLPLLYLACLRESHWRCCKRCSVQHPPWVSVTSLVSQADELPKRQRYIRSRAAWWMRRHKTLIKNRVVKTAVVFFPLFLPWVEYVKSAETCADSLGFVVTGSGDNVYTYINSRGS